MAEGLVDRILNEGRKRMESDVEADDREPGGGAGRGRYRGRSDNVRGRRRTHG